MASATYNSKGQIVTLTQEKKDGVSLDDEVLFEYDAAGRLVDARNSHRDPVPVSGHGNKQAGLILVGLTTGYFNRVIVC